VSTEREVPESPMPAGVPATGHPEVQGSPSPETVKQIKRRAGSKGGHAPRAVAVIGLNLPAEQTPTIDLKTAAAQIAVLEAVALALVRGKTSGLVAQSLIAAVKAANTILVTDQGQQLAEIERQLAARGIR
jgi:hypothetical protein